MADTIFVGNDNFLEVSALKNSATDEFINDATVTVTLTDSAGSQVAGETWPLAVSYINASDGVYRATLRDTLTLTAGQLYRATVTADAGAGLLATWIRPLRALNRIA